MERAVCDNPFASALLFYYNHRRAKLKSDDLEKIARKYTSKPSQLIADLTAKYKVSISSSVYSTDIERICTNFSVPEAYLKLLHPYDHSSSAYDPTLDCLLESFDAQKAFTSNRIIASPRGKEVPRLDNISKVTHLVPGFVGHLPSYITPDTVHVHVPKPKDHVDSTPVLKRIAVSSLQYSKPKSSNYEEDISSFKSPLLLVHECMESKRRVRVMIRKGSR